MPKQLVKCKSLPLINQTLGCYRCKNNDLSTSDICPCNDDRHPIKVKKERKPVVKCVSEVNMKN